MFDEYLQGKGNNAVSVDLLGRTSVCNALFKADGERRGKGRCLTLGFKPAFPPSAALIWLHFLRLKMLTPFSFLLVKIILDGGGLLPKGFVREYLCGDFFF